MAIAGYHSYKQKNQLQSMAGYRQTKVCYWTRVNQGERKAPQTEYTRDNSNMLTLYVLLYA